MAGHPAKGKGESMKRKLVNRKAANSIGIGIMALITAVAPVMSAAAEEGGSASAAPDKGVTVQSGDSGTKQGAEPSAATQAVKDAQAENAEIKENIENKNSEYQEENPGQEAVSDEKVVEKLEGSQQALGTLGEKTDVLDDLNAKADEANADLKDALDHAEEGIDKEIEAIEGGTKAVEELEKVTTDQIVTDAKESADSVVEAQEKTYENAEAAQEAKDKALAEAAEIEAAKDAALEKQEQARIDLERAEGNLELLQKNTEAAAEKYSAAVLVVDNANAKLEAILGDLNISADDLVVNEETGELTVDEKMSAEVKKALQDAWDALKQAEADKAKADKEYGSALINQKSAQNAYDAAQGELKTATDALAELTTAQEELEKAEEEENERAAEYSDLMDVKNEAEVVAPAKKAEAQKEYDEAKETLKGAQQELLAGTAKEQEAASKSAYETYKEAEKEANKVLVGDDKKKAEEAEKKAKDEYIARTDAQTETLIRYQLQEGGLVDDADDVIFSKWVSTREDNNYLLVSYPAKDENGNNLKEENGDVVLTHEYYDYKESEGTVIVLKKEEASGERVYECGNVKTNAVPLTISNNENGEQEFYLGNYKLNDSYKVIGDADAGYRVENADGTSVKLEIEDQNYNIVGGDAIKLTTVKLPGETVYFVNGKMASVEFGPAGLVIQKIDGKGVSLIAGNKQVALNEMVFGPKFSDKGNPQTIDTSASSTGKELSELETSASAAKENKKEKEESLADADESLKKAEENWNAVKDTEETVKKNWDDAIGAKEQAQNKVDGVKAPWVNDDIDSDGVEGYLNKFIAEKTPEVEGFLEELMRANDEVKAKDKRNDIAGAVDGQVQDAYQNVVEAIKELYNLKKATVQNKERWEELEEKCRDAVEEYTAAAEAKGLSDKKCEEIKEAAERAISAANGNFAYNTPPTGGDGGTTGGGTTGGGGTGGTGGTTAPTTPTAPVVVVPEEAVPLAGAGMTNPVAVRRTAGVSAATAGETGTGNGAGTMSAGGDEKIGGELKTLEDEETPLASPEEEKETGALVIEDEETPLAAPIEEQGRMSWWWLLLIAVLGVTGEEMYRRHRKKMQEEMDA